MNSRNLSFPAVLAGAEGVSSGDAPAEPVPGSGDAPAPTRDLPTEPTEPQEVSGDAPAILEGAVEPVVEVVTGDAEPEDEPFELDIRRSGGATPADQEGLRATEQAPEILTAEDTVPVGEASEAPLAAETPTGSTDIPMRSEDVSVRSQLMPPPERVP